MSDTPTAKTPGYHRLLLGLFCGINAALLFLFLLHLPVGLDTLELAFRGWAQARPRIDIVAGLVVALAAIGYFGLARLGPALKTRLVYSGGPYAHPGHEAFYSLKEPPFDRKPLLRRYPEIKDSAYSPEVQYRTFRRLLDKHAAVDVIGGSVAGWHVLRDLYLAALLFLAGFLLSWPLNGEVNPALALSYMFVFGAQALFLMFSARGAGRRLVQNVLMVELGLDKADAGKEKKKKF
ncbi:MAG TPA: hypothetical protein VIX81_06365 [Gammaproteobacteria bacterium]